MATSPQSPPVSGTNPPTPPKVVPLVQPGQVTPVVAPGTTPVGLNNQVLQAGQQAALQGFQTPTLDLTSQATRNLLASPSGQFNPQQYVQTGMDAFNLNLAQQQEKLRRETAPSAQSGERLGQLVDFAFRGAQEGAMTRADLERQANQQQLENLYSAIKEGRETSELERKRFETNVGALVDIRGAAEGERAQTVQMADNAISRGLQVALANQNAALQTSLTELQGKIDQGLLLQEQDFQGSQAELDRQLQTALQQGDIEGAMRIQAAKADIDSAAAYAQRTWQTTERLATQTWQRGERLGEQEFLRLAQYYDQQHDLALQNGDLLAAKEIERLRAENELRMMTQEMTHAERMLVLQQEYQTAEANKNVDRQKQILGYQSKLEIDEMTQRYGFEEGMAQFNANLQEVLAANDHVRAMAMLEAQQAFTSSEAALDRQIEEAYVQMKQRGIDYELIENEIASGRLDPQAALDFVKQQFPDMDLSAANPDAIYEQLDRDYKVQQYQFAQANPEYAEYDANGNFVGLKPEGAALFQNVLKNTYYGPDGKPVVGGTAAGAGIRLDPQGLVMVDANGQKMAANDISVALRGADFETNANHATYQQLVASSRTFSPYISDLMGNNLDLGDVVEGMAVNVSGRLMIITKGKYREKDLGRNADAFEIMDVATGTTRLFTGNTGESYSVNELKGWADGLAATATK